MKSLKLWILAISLGMAMVAFGEVIYQENFDSLRTLDGFEQHGGQWSIAEGKLVGRGNGYLARILLPPVAKGQDIALEADFRMTYSPQPMNWASIFVRYVHGKVPVFIQMPVRYSGWMEIAEAKINEEGKFDWQVYRATQIGDKKKAEDFRRLRLEVRGIVAKTFVDGKPIATTLLAGRTEHDGRVGICSSVTGIEIDNIVVETLPPVSAEEREKLLFEGSTRPLVIAHQGYFAQYPGNTLEAVRAAIACGADVVEVDVRLSKDCIPYCMHDDTVQGTTDGRGKGCGMTMEQLKTLNAGFRRGEKFKHCKVPTFEEIVVECKKTKTPILIDLKEGRAAKAICEILKAHDYFDSVLVGTGSADTAKVFKSYHPGVTLIATSGYLDNPGQDYMLKLKRDGFDAVFTAFRRPFKVDVKLVRKSGLALYVWTIDNASDVVAAWRHGADGIVTNEPEMALNTLKRIQRAIGEW